MISLITLIMHNVVVGVFLYKVPGKIKKQNLNFRLKNREISPCVNDFSMKISGTDTKKRNLSFQNDFYILIERPPLTLSSTHSTLINKYIDIFAFPEIAINLYTVIYFVKLM